jgi:hypothetical protein
VREVIAVECLGGPEDGAIVRVEKQVAQTFTRFIPNLGFLNATYALAVDDGRFVLRYLSSSVEID